MNNVDDLAKLDRDYDAVLGIGSLMHAPLDVVKPEFDALSACLNLRVGVSSCTPTRRSAGNGRDPSLPSVGRKTDGPGTPWAEWYDADKLIDALRPPDLKLVYYCEYRHGDMNCIDLVRSGPQQVLPADSVLFARADSSAGRDTLGRRVLATRLGRPPPDNWARMLELCRRDPPHG
jgi:hypothetical protein